jgi:alpha-ketoglutarate-dependent 2,4-dichlorophenoxyacetate dioxygenase
MLLPLKPGFAARLDGIQAATASDADVAAIKVALLDYPVLVLPGQELDADQQIAFGARFGPLETNEIAAQGYSPGIRKEMLEVSNVGDTNVDAEQIVRRRQMDLGNRFWHTDGSYKVVPCHLSMLYGIKVANKDGETQFADMRAGYDAIPDDIKAEIETMVAFHRGSQARVMIGFDKWLDSERAFIDLGTAYDLVRTLPETGRRTIYLSAHASHIIGMPVPEGRVLLHELTEIATAPAHVYTHRWQVGDLVIYDNRCTMHRLRRYDVEKEQRVLRRVATLDMANPARDPAQIERALQGASA